MGGQKYSKRNETYGDGLNFVVNLIVGFTIIEFSHVHGTDKWAICMQNVTHKNLQSEDATYCETI